VSDTTEAKQNYFARLQKNIFLNDEMHKSLRCKKLL